MGEREEAWDETGEGRGVGGFYWERGEEGFWNVLPETGSGAGRAGQVD